MQRGLFIDEYGQYKPLKWNSVETLEEALNVPLAYIESAAILANREDKHTYDREHYGLKYDLDRHV